MTNQPNPFTGSNEIEATCWNYADLAAVTECPYEGPTTRLNNIEMLDRLQINMGRSISLGDAQDRLKKYIFYGKADSLTGLETGRSLTSDVDKGVYQRLTDPKVIRLLHAGIGLQTEASEFQEALYNHIFHGEPLDEANLFEEAGDTCWYVGIICKVLGRRLKDLLTWNIRKLANRYGQKFSEFFAIHRNLDNERKIVEAAVEQ